MYEKIVEGANRKILLFIHETNNVHEKGNFLLDDIMGNIMIIVIVIALK